MIQKTQPTLNSLNIHHSIYAMERFRDESCVKGNIKIFMNGKLTMNKRYSRAIGMLQNTEAGSGHMLGQLRPGQHHVTMVPAWHCSALPILQHWAPDFLTALQPPALLSPGSTQQTITTSSPSTLTRPEVTGAASVTCSGAGGKIRTCGGRGLAPGPAPGAGCGGGQQEAMLGRGGAWRGQGQGAAGGGGRCRWLEVVLPWRGLAPD